MKQVHATIGSLHHHFIFRRRARVLSEALAALIPDGSSVLDIGCGSGEIGYLIRSGGRDISVKGIDVLVRPRCLIECNAFDGMHIPFADASFDVCMFIDVLHHAANHESLLAEACRVSRRYVLIKDHLCESSFDALTLKVMDWVGNRPHGVSLTYAYLGKRLWRESFSSYGLKIDRWSEDIPLYPFPLSLLFGRDLHFVALLEKKP